MVSPGARQACRRADRPLIFLGGKKFFIWAPIPPFFYASGRTSRFEDPLTAHVAGLNIEGSLEVRVLQCRQGFAAITRSAPTSASWHVIDRPLCTIVAPFLPNGPTAR